MSDINIRQANSADIDSIAIIFDAYRVAFGATSNLDISRKFLADRLAKSESVIFLAEFASSSLFLGFVQLYPSFASISANSIWILNDLFVDFRHRRQGIASKLLNAVHEFSRSTGASRVTLITEHTNLAAQQLYESFGYKLDTEFRRYSLAL